MQKLIAMIPARMGSKRVPKKNIRLLCGKPLIQYAIDAARNSGEFKEIWVNSESELLGSLAHENRIHFHKRPDHLATDTATNQDFTEEFLQGHDCDYVVMVNPTSPLLTPKTVSDFCRYVRQGGCDTVLSVLQEKAECLFRGKPVNFSTERKINSQNLEPVEKVVWAMTAWRRSHFLDFAEQKKCSVFAGKLGTFPVPLREAVDIDTQEEWDIAESTLLAKLGIQAETDGKPTIPKYWGQDHEDE